MVHGSRKTALGGKAAAFVKWCCGDCLLFLFAVAGGILVAAAVVACRVGLLLVLGCGGVHDCGG